VNQDPVQVTYEAYLLATWVPHRFIVTLYVNNIPTGIGRVVWLKRRAVAAMHEMVHHGNDLIHEFGVAAEIAAEIYAQRREEAMAKVQVGDSVKLLVDIGQFKKGRVCKVVDVAEPSFYEARGTTKWDDEKYPIRVIPISVATDRVSLGPKDYIPLARGEFGPLFEETEDD
jgi:hypothetical protein